MYSNLLNGCQISLPLILKPGLCNESMHPFICWDNQTPSILTSGTAFTKKSIELLEFLNYLSYHVSLEEIPFPVYTNKFTTLILIMLL